VTPEYPTQIVEISTETFRQVAVGKLKNAPLGIEMVLREKKKPRTTEANGFQWAGMLGDFAREGWVDGKLYSEEVWHELLKAKFLPDQPTDGLTLKGYVKWVEMPDGSVRMVGSTTKLTVKGMSWYLERCMAYGASELGVRFSMAAQ